MAMLPLNFIVRGLQIIMLSQVVISGKYILTTTEYPKTYTTATEESFTVKEGLQYKVDKQIENSASAEIRDNVYKFIRNRSENKNNEYFLCKCKIEDVSNSRQTRIQYYPSNKMLPTREFKETIKSFYENLLAKINQKGVDLSSSQSNSNNIKLPLSTAPKEETAYIPIKDKQKEMYGKKPDSNNQGTIKVCQDAYVDIPIEEESAEELKDKEYIFTTESEEKTVNIENANIVEKTSKDDVSFHGSSRRSGNSVITIKPYYGPTFDLS